MIETTHFRLTRVSQTDDESGSQHGVTTTSSGLDDGSGDNEDGSDGHGQPSTVLVTTPCGGYHRWDSVSGG